MRYICRYRITKNQVDDLIIAVGLESRGKKSKIKVVEPRYGTDNYGLNLPPKATDTTSHHSQLRCWKNKFMRILNLQLQNAST